MDRETRLRERLSLALRHAMQEGGPSWPGWSTTPEYAQQSAWVAYVAKHTGVNPRRVQAHMACENRCSLADGFAYFDFFGPDFEHTVRGKIP
jgi:hypothetical protein